MSRADAARSDVFAWNAPDESSRYVPADALAHMREGGAKPARRSDWFKMRSVPVRLTVVDPHAAAGVSRRRMDRWVAVAKTATAAIDNLSGPDPLRPASLDVTVYLWNGRKLLLPEDDGIAPRNANTGVTSRELATGHARVLVYRREEAVKTLVHELLHAYRFGDWANEDAEMQERVRALAGAKRLRVASDEALKPTEALVDAMAVRMTEHLFGGRSWGDCLRHAERLAARLVARCACDGGEWRQTTGAFEYYCVKTLLMRGMNDFLAAHLSGLQRPDKGKVRALLRPEAFLPQQEYSLARSAHKSRPAAAMCLRMTPHRLAPSP